MKRSLPCWRRTRRATRTAQRSTGTLGPRTGGFPPHGWRLYAQDKGIAFTNVTAVTLPGVVTSPGHGLLTGDHTRISRTKGIVGLNRIWLVTKIDNDTFQLNVPPAGGFVGALTAPGKSQKQSRAFQTLTDAQIIRTTEHKVGRPFGLFSGRRKRRVS